MVVVVCCRCVIVEVAGGCGFVVVTLVLALTVFSEVGSSVISTSTATVTHTVSTFCFVFLFLF